nr:MAG TPA: hypothetical protein [Caudoviricetes sp.]
MTGSEAFFYFFAPKEIRLLMELLMPAFYHRQIRILFHVSLLSF